MARSPNGAGWGAGRFTEGEHVEASLPLVGAELVGLGASELSPALRRILHSETAQSDDLHREVGGQALRAPDEMLELGRVSGSVDGRDQGTREGLGSGLS